MFELIGPRECRDIINKMLSFSKASQCIVKIYASEIKNARFANNDILGASSLKKIGVGIISTLSDHRTGAYKVNQFTTAALREAVTKSEELARSALPDLEYMAPLGAQKFPRIDSFDRKTNAADSKSLIDALGIGIRAAERKGFNAAGSLALSGNVQVIGDNRGLFGYYRDTDVSYSITTLTPTEEAGSGWAGAESHRLRDINFPGLSQIAIQKAEASRKPRALPPGRYTVILEPAASAEIIKQMFLALDARAASEGRSVFSKVNGETRVGENVCAKKITLRTDPFDSRNPGLPWTDWELPAQKITWIENGRLKNLSYSRYWGRVCGRSPTPAPRFLILDGEHLPTSALIKSTRKGLLVTRFSYVRLTNVDTLQLTGVTRDGLFLIEDGKVTYPVNNLRWVESPLGILSRVEMLGSQERVLKSIVPSLKVSDFNFTGVTNAI